MARKAVIWDLDGVIVDTIPHHLEAWRQLFNKKGKQNFVKGDFREIFGQRNDDTIKKAFGEEISPQEIAALSQEKEEYFRLQITKGNIKPLPGVLELLASLREVGFHQALVSSAPMKNIALLLSSLGINEDFEVIIASEDVSRGKPDPEGFLLAASKLNVEERRCVVIEDTVPGIKAAKRAGMGCLAIIGVYERESLAEADMVADSLERVTVKDLERLLR
jgi:beta-phosphoglucomutase